MGFEELLDQVGGFGPFQLWTLGLTTLPRILLPLHFFLPVFLAAVPSHHCALPDTPANISHQDLWLEVHLPREPDGTFSSCFHFAHPRALLNSTLWGEAQSPRELEAGASTVPCSQGWEYDNSELSSTIATEWDLVCEHRGLNKLTSTLFFAGVMVGAVIFGYLSDRFGRRRLLLVSYVSSLVLGLASVASVNYVMFTITRTFTGMALAGLTVIVLPLELEWLDMEHRTVAGILSSMFWSGGVMLLALIGYLIRDWRWLLLTVTLPSVLGIISMWWIPESARWLLTQGRVQEAQRYLLRCAKINGRPVGKNSLSMETLSKVAATERVVRKPSYLDLFRTPRLRHISLCCMVTWFGMNFSYYGLTLDLSGLGLSVYQTQLLFAVVELPAKLLIYVTVRHAGRRPTEVGTLVGTALTFCLQLLVPSETKSWRTALAVMGKAFSTAAYTTAYLMTSELYPTVLRQTGLGLTSLVGRLGSSLAPLAALMDGVWLSLPDIVYGGLTLLAACTAFLLPETKQAQLQETIQDVEKSALRNIQEEETRN